MGIRETRGLGIGDWGIGILDFRFWILDLKPIQNCKSVFSQRERLRQEKFAQRGEPPHATFVFSTRGCANDTLRERKIQN
ncbi:hypothetical protein NIES37_08550 [Tolypothrix tenuis PCC 7101]|uniref:Uncharacterized protein n=1 Tax=Tolypothrix tenuis PCC 7101 TaxID=231146 RepID=A0A1Z4MTW4_9CYAN|nr:hypothetical protein NIES37_08550 [Tolypothrix tenuis PCC 7101]BAZ72574.1 hypothetical protein NIES50_11280 [Aulosira laxa NIES-50]